MDYVDAYLSTYAIVAVIAGVVCGFITKSINESRGGEGGFWWGCLLGVIGIIIVAVRPMDGNNSNQSNSAPSRQYSAPVTSAADELKKYKELLDQGIITEEEYQKKKEQLLRML